MLSLPKLLALGMAFLGIAVGVRAACLLSWPPEITVRTTRPAAVIDLAAWIAAMGDRWEDQEALVRALGEQPRLAPWVEAAWTGQPSFAIYWDDDQPSLAEVAFRTGKVDREVLSPLPCFARAGMRLPRPMVKDLPPGNEEDFGPAALYACAAPAFGVREPGSHPVVETTRGAIERAAIAALAKDDARRAKQAHARLERAIMGVAVQSPRPFVIASAVLSLADPELRCVLAGQGEPGSTPDTQWTLGDLEPKGTAFYLLACEGGSLADAEIQAEIPHREYVLTQALSIHAALAALFALCGYGLLVNARLRTKTRETRFAVTVAAVAAFGLALAAMLGGL